MKSSKDRLINHNSKNINQIMAKRLFVVPQELTVGVLESSPIKEKW